MAAKKPILVSLFSGCGGLTSDLSVLDSSAFGQTILTAMHRPYSRRIWDLLMVATLEQSPQVKSRLVRY